MDKISGQPITNKKRRRINHISLYQNVLESFRRNLALFSDIGAPKNMFFNMLSWQRNRKQDRTTAARKEKESLIREIKKSEANESLGPIRFAITLGENALFKSIGNGIEQGFRLDRFFQDLFDRQPCLIRFKPKRQIHFLSDSCDHNNRSPLNVFNFV